MAWIDPGLTDTGSLGSDSIAQTVMSGTHNLVWEGSTRNTPAVLPYEALKRKGWTDIAGECVPHAASTPARVTALT